MEKLSLLDINLIIPCLALSTIRTYLGNYKFSKFRTNTRINNKPRVAYYICDEFLDNLEEILVIRKQYKALKYLEEYRRDKDE